MSDTLPTSPRLALGRVLQNTRELVSLVQVATGARPQTTQSPHDVEPSLAWYYALRGNHQLGTPPDARVVRLLERLRADPSLKMFDSNLQVVSNGAALITYEDLASWLVVRAEAAGAAQAVADLERYIATDNLPFLSVVAIAGATIDRSHSFGHGLTLMPWSEVPNSPYTEYVHNHFWPIPFITLSAAFVRREVLPRLHVAGTDTPPLTPVDVQDHYDATLCLGLTIPFAPRAVANWVQGEDWMPVMTGGYGVDLHTTRVRSHNIGVSECSLAAQHFMAFKALSSEKRDALRLPLSRLNQAMLRPYPVDASIDLGIVLESLFLRDMPDDRGEISFRLRMRGARYLGGSKTERAELFRTIGDLYALRSGAAHTGRVPDTMRGAPTSDLLSSGYTLAARALTRVIHEGEPDWNHVLFG